MASGPAPHLNKADLALINDKMRVLTEIVGHCCILVEGHESSSLGTGAETAHATRAEADVERARAEVSAVIASPKYTTEVWQTVNYAKAPPLSFPFTAPAETLAIYPSEGSELKSADQMKAALKSIKLGEIGAQIVDLGRVANSGIIQKTATQEAATQIKAAIPASL